MKFEVVVDESKARRRAAFEAKRAAMADGRRERSEMFVPKTTYKRKEKYPASYEENLDYE